MNIRNFQPQGRSISIESTLSATPMNSTFNKSIWSPTNVTQNTFVLERPKFMVAGRWNFRRSVQFSKDHHRDYKSW